jgi:hypothetical protein
MLDIGNEYSIGTQCGCRNSLSKKKISIILIYWLDDSILMNNASFCNETTESLWEFKSAVEVQKITW